MNSEENLEYVLWLLDDTIKKDLWYEINTENAKILKEYIQELQDRIDKAIELIEKDRKKNYGSLEKKSFYCSKTNEILEILRGDKE